MRTTRGIPAALALLFWLCPLGAATTNARFANPIDTGYGAAGRFEVQRDSIPTPAMNDAHIHLFRPAGTDTIWPVIFFCHGIGADNPINYLELLTHIASRGHAVVYSPYPQAVAMARPRAAYDMMHKGFDHGIRAWSSLLDTTRIGFVGHSYGGGAVPAISQHWLTRRRWGTQGAFLYIMAPWYSYDITQQQLEAFPDSVALIMQVFEDDHVNDHRMAKDIFENIAIPATHKNFVVLHSDSSAPQVLRADHGVPTGAAGGESLDRLDYYGVWRLIDALCGYAFDNDSGARALALGSGGERQRFMGRWPDGTAVRELTGTHTAFVLHPQNSYLNFWSHKFNPRYEHTTFFDALLFWRNRGRMTIRNYVTLKPGGVDDTGSIIAPHSTRNLDFAPIDSGYGAPGPYRVRKRDFPQPSLGHGKIYILSPVGIDTAAPVIVFLHGFQWPMPDFYQGLLGNIASQGYHVIFPSYMLYRTTLNNRKRYDLMIKGTEEALVLLGANADTTRVGFVGHSYGGGAVPAVAWHYLKLKEWGGNGAFMFISAPWYVYYFRPHQFEYFPAHTRLLVQVYEQERFNDWRMAEDLFYSFSSIPYDQKDFMIVHSDHYKGKILEAEHVSALSSGDGDINAIDFHALYRPLDALAAYTFTGDTTAGNIALGGGSPRQIRMGTWPDNTPVTELTVTDRPVTPYNRKSYLFDWNRPWNKRRRHYEPVEKARPEWLYRIQRKRK